MSTKGIKAFKLTSSSGAYWRGIPTEPCFREFTEQPSIPRRELAEYLEYLDNIKNRDHNKLGRDMELFATVDVIGQGLPLLMPKGAKMIQTLQRWIEDEEEKRGYMRTKTPLMAKKDLYIISDHWNHYKEGMFVLGDEEKEDEVFALRPMTYPFQYYVYKQSQKSYRDLPLPLWRRLPHCSGMRIQGEMHGLTRVRQFTISEGPFDRKGRIRSRKNSAAVDLAKYCLTTLGLEEDVTYRLSKWDPNNKDKYLGDEETWDYVQNMMRDILHHIGIEFTEEDGEAAFYGPKLDIQAKERVRQGRYHDHHPAGYVSWQSVLI